MSEQSTAPSAAPSPAAVASPAIDDPLAALQLVSSEVTAVEQPEPGRWTVSTSIEDPRGEQGSPAAQIALAVCQEAVRLGATYVSVAESDGTTFVLYGHPSYGKVCTEV